MKIQRSLLLVSALLLVACVPKSVPEQQGGHPTASNASRDLSVEQLLAEEGTIAFRVWDSADVFTQYGISHTKEMHLIVVREDLQHFSHLHPTMDEDGTWRINYSPPFGGVYWFYADFVDATGVLYTLKFTRAVSGLPGPVNFERNFDRMSRVNGYQVEFLPSGQDPTYVFEYEITDDDGPVEVEEYLGARGHSIILTLAGDFIHTHPDDKSDNPFFSVSGLRPGTFYRIFTQFQINGEVKLVTFDWQS